MLGHIRDLWVYIVPSPSNVQFLRLYALLSAAPCMHMIDHRVAKLELWSREETGS